MTPSSIKDSHNTSIPPRLRYRRILVPGLAYLITGGQPQYIDAGLIAVNLLFIFAGVYWLSRYVSLSGHNAGWGLLFLVVPAVLVSIDRLTVDLALTALCVAFGFYLAERQPLKLYGVMLLAPMARETGLLLVAAYSITQLFDRRIKRGLLFATSAAPAFAWYSFVDAHTTSYSVAGWFTFVPLGGAFTWMIHPPEYPFSPPVAWTATVLDECALAGMVVAILLSFRFPLPARRRAMTVGALLMTLSGLNLGPVFWENAFGFGRIFSPALVLLAMPACSTKSWAYLLPIALITPRIALQLAYDTLRIMRG
jgi:hypothetical protein